VKNVAKIIDAVVKKFHANFRKTLEVLTFPKFNTKIQICAYEKCCEHNCFQESLRESMCKPGAIDEIRKI
jgi:hypothetical protein